MSISTVLLDMDDDEAIGKTCRLMSSVNFLFTSAEVITVR